MRLVSDTVFVINLKVTDFVGADIKHRLTGQTIPIVMRISLSIKKNILQDQSNPKTHARSRWFFSKNSWGKPISISK